MISREFRGDNMGGLVRYLLGAGRANEHHNPRVIAGCPELLAPFGETLDAGQRQVLVDQLEYGHRLHGVEVTGGHVFHIAIANAAEDPELSDDQWGEIAERILVDLGFEDPAKAGCQWAAIRHGRSAGGNDHLHVAVSLVREDGTKMSLWQYKKKLSVTLAGLEDRYGLTVVDGRKHGDGMPGYEPAEVARAAAEGRSETHRATLARTVRTAAGTSWTETEFVRRLAERGVWVRPRFDPRDHERVTGYAVALTPTGGAKPVFYGGGTLAPDLRLPAMRFGWTATEADVADTWRAAEHAQHSGEPADWPTTADPAPHREARVIDASIWDEAIQRVDAAITELAAVDPQDDLVWRYVAGQTAVVVGALAEQGGPAEESLRRAAIALAVSAQSGDRPRWRPPPSSALHELRTVALVMAQGTIGANSARAWPLLANQFLTMARAINDAHKAHGELQRARSLVDGAQMQLLDARHALEQHAATVQPAVETTRTRKAPRPPLPIGLRDRGRGYDLEWDPPGHEDPDRDYGR